MNGRWSGYGTMARHVAPAGTRLLDHVRHTDGPVLDLGSGTGSTLQRAGELGIDAVGIDASMEQLQSASTELAQVRADALRLPFPDDTFAAAFSNMALIFVPDPASAAAEVARVLRPDAPFGFTAWRPNGWPDACRAILADALGRPPSRFPTTLGEEAPAAGLLGDAGFTGVDHHDGTLRWWFADLSDAVETLTNAAGGLRLLRRDLESQGRWSDVRPRVAEVLGARTARLGDQLILDDPYLMTVGHASAKA